jgi:hypothetical protein
MRRLNNTTSLITTVITTVTTGVAAATLLAAPAGAMPSSGHEAGQQSAARHGLSCSTGVIGVDSGRHVRDDVFLDDRLVSSSRTSATLPFQATAFGFFGSTGSADHSRLQVNVVASDGVPRNVTLNRRKDSLRLGAVDTYRDRSFHPRLYADNLTYFAYTVTGGSMTRWALSRYPGGSLGYAAPVRVGRGFRDLTSLQAASVAKVHGVESELLYATTHRGELLQIVVPLDHPGHARVHTIARTGYDGVSELSWTVCNDQGRGDLHSLIAIDPAANRATWTTIRHAFSRPRAQLRGDVTGETDWHLAAVF